MDAIQESMNQLAAIFIERMNALENELHKGAPAAATTSALSSDFFNFKSFILKSLRSLQEQIDLIQQSVDQVEMRSRRKILLIHGVPENKQENTATVVSNIISEKLKFNDFNATDIRRSHRMGKLPTAGERPRPILFKLCELVDRNKIWFAKTELKGTGITISEFLTKRRHRLFMQARQRLGVKSCWTRDGTIYVLSRDGIRHRIEKASDLDTLSNSSDVSDDLAQSMPKGTIPMSKTRRQAAVGKK